LINSGHRKLKVKPFDGPILSPALSEVEGEAEELRVHLGT